MTGGSEQHNTLKGNRNAAKGMQVRGVWYLLNVCKCKFPQNSFNVSVNQSFGNSSLLCLQINCFVNNCI